MEQAMALHTPENMARARVEEACVELEGQAEAAVRGDRFERQAIVAFLESIDRAQALVAKTQLLLEQSQRSANALLKYQDIEDPLHVRWQGEAQRLPGWVERCLAFWRPKVA